MRVAARPPACRALALALVDSVVVEFAVWDSDSYGWMLDRVPDDLTQFVSQGLKPRWPDLAIALEDSSYPNPAWLLKGPNWLVSYLEQANSASLRPSGRRLLRLGVDLALRQVHFEWQDTVTIATWQHPFQVYGVEFTGDHFSDGDGYYGSLLLPDSTEAGADIWGDIGFWLLQTQGWETASPCRYAGVPGADRELEHVLSHGEQYLREHPNSEMWPAIALTVARAHETAVGIAGIKPSDALDFTVRVLGIRGSPHYHRKRAMELYQQLSRLPISATSRRWFARTARMLLLGQPTTSNTFTHFCD